MRRLLHTALLGVVLVASARADPGTDFWAVSVLDDRQSYDFSIVVGNPDPVLAATVTVETESAVVDTAAVPPLSTHEFVLGWSRRASRSVLARLAYRVCSDRPVHAYQFVTFRSTGNTSAAVLADRSVFGTDYLALAIPADIVDTRPSLVTVVAPGPARVEVTPSVDTQAGPGVPALLAGTTATFDLDAFDVLQVGSLASLDITGTVIRSNAPVEAFAGCENCVVGLSSADRVQELMIPVALWGTTVPAVTSFPKTSDQNRWRILAAADGTTVTTDPPQAGTPASLDRGRFLEIVASSDFVVTATKPVLVERIIGWCRDGKCDPSTSLMLPPELFAPSATFALTNDFASHVNWVDIVATAGASVEVDGLTLTPADFTPIGSSGYLHAQPQLSLATPAHTVNADRPIGIYAGHTGFAQAGGFPADIGQPANLAPVCSAGGPYAAACAGPTTKVQVSGAGSSDPEGKSLRYLWSSVFSQVSFDDPTRVDPLVTVAGIGAFSLDLIVSDGLLTSKCAANLTVSGDPSLPPELDRSTTPLWLVKQGRDVRFSWQDLGGAPMTYSVYEGPLQSYWSHVALACNQPGTPAAGGRRETVVRPGPGSVYFQMTAANCAAEGPSGGDPARSMCPP